MRFPWLLVLGLACRPQSAAPQGDVVPQRPVPAPNLPAPNLPPTQNARPEPSRGEVTDEAYPMEALPHARVTLTDAYGGKHPVDVELATDEGSRTRGLMWRRALADGAGMLFIFQGDAVHSFWMRNTLIPLDMLFITAQGRVAGIVAQATPQTLSPRTVGKASRYVLEVPGGWCENKSILPGSLATFEGLKGLEIR